VLFADRATELVREFSCHSRIIEAPANVVPPRFASASPGSRLDAAEGVKLTYRYQFFSEACLRHEHFDNVRKLAFSLLRRYGAFAEHARYRKCGRHLEFASPISSCDFLTKNWRFSPIEKTAENPYRLFTQQ